MARKRQNPKAEPAMNPSKTFFNQEIKLSENNQMKNTVTRLITGNRSVKSRLISLPPKNEGQRALSSGRNKERSLSSKDLRLPKEKSHDVPCLSAFLSRLYVPRRQRPRLCAAVQCRNSIKTCYTNETSTGSQA